MNLDLLNLSGCSLCKHRVVWALFSMVALLGCGPVEDPPPTADEGKAGPVCPAFLPGSENLPTGKEWRTHPAIGDVNGDGLDDFAAMARKGKGPRVFLSDGLGSWTEASEGLAFGGTFSCGIGTVFGDLNRDGRLDLVAADHCSGVYAYLGDGGSSWTPASQGIPRNLQGFNDADLADLDGDGLLDIVAISAYGRGFLVLKGQSSGVWKVLHDTGLPEVGSGWELKLADINGDGLVDIALSFNPAVTERRYEPPPPAKVWLQQSGLKFTPTTGFPDKGRFHGMDLRWRPGKTVPDLVFALTGARAGIYVYESESGQEWRTAGRIDEAWFPERRSDFVGLTVADFNSDGCSDLVTTEGGSRKAWLAMSDCEGGWTLCPEETLPMESGENAAWGTATGDFNGDGLDDVVAAFGGSSEGSLRVWLRNPH